MNKLTEKQIWCLQIVRERRIRLGVSLRAMARTLNLSPSYYSKIERGDVIASVETYSRILIACGIVDRRAFLESIGFVRMEVFIRPGLLLIGTRQKP